MIFKPATYLIFFLFIVFANSWVWRKILPEKIYAIALFPGIVIHELSHVLGCLLTGAKITKIKLFSFKGGYVRYRKVGPVRSMIISFFPVVGGLAALFILTQVVTKGASFQIILDTFGLGFRFWIFFYFSVSIIICMIPSMQDLKNALLGFLLFILIVVLINPLFEQEIRFLILRSITILETLSVISITSLLFALLAYSFKLAFGKLIKLL